MESAPGTQPSLVIEDPDTPPVDAALRVLADELEALTSWMAAQPDFAHTVGLVKRFGALIWSTPSLRAHQRDVLDRLTTETAKILAARVGADPDGVEPLIAATMLLGLWQAHFASLRRQLDIAGSAKQLLDAVADDVQRAAKVVRDGLRSWPQGRSGR